jgi:hypothetical protein
VRGARKPDIIRQVLAPDIRWEVAEGFPYSGVGPDHVLHDFFSRLFQDSDSFEFGGVQHRSGQLHGAGKSDAEGARMDRLPWLQDSTAGADIAIVRVKAVLES